MKKSIHINPRQRLAVAVDQAIAYLDQGGDLSEGDYQVLETHQRVRDGLVDLELGHVPAVFGKAKKKRHRGHRPADIQQYRLNAVAYVKALKKYCDFTDEEARNEVGKRYRRTAGAIKKWIKEKYKGLSELETKRAQENVEDRVRAFAHALHGGPTLQHILYRASEDGQRLAALEPKSATKGKGT